MSRGHEEIIENPEKRSGSSRAGTALAFSIALHLVALAVLVAVVALTPPVPRIVWFDLTVPDFEGAMAAMSGRAPAAAPGSARPAKVPAGIHGPSRPVTGPVVAPSLPPSSAAPSSQAAPPASSAAPASPEFAAGESTPAVPIAQVALAATVAHVAAPAVPRSAGLADGVSGFPPVSSSTGSAVIRESGSGSGFAGGATSSGSGAGRGGLSAGTGTGGASAVHGTRREGDAGQAFGDGTGAVPRAPRALRDRIQSRVAYPAESVRREEEGEVLLRVFVGAGGAPGEIRLERSSGIRRLDDAARRGVSGAAPLPSSPGWYEVPVRFSLR